MDKPKARKDTLSTRLSGVEGTLKAVLTNLGEINATLRLANGGSKKPRRIEALTVTIAVIVAIQSIGLLDGIKAALMQWLGGG